MPDWPWRSSVVAVEPYARSPLPALEVLRSPSSTALTASAQRVTGKTSRQTRRLIQPWQQRALDYIDLIPEMNFAAEFYARYLGQLRVFVAEVDPEDPDAEPIATEDKAVQALLDRVQDPGGGRTGLQEAYGRLRFVIGECYLVVSTDSEIGEERWEMLSPAELRMVDGGYTRFAAPGLPPEQLRDPPDTAFQAIPPGSAVVYRMWKKHPKYSLLAQSSVQACLDVCEELIALTQAVFARSRSRLAGSGFLLLDESLRDLSNAKNPDDDPFWQNMRDAMLAPIQNPDSASAVVPLAVWGGMKNGQAMVEMLKVHDPKDTYPETGLRQEAIGRLANGLDFPREVLTGVADMNHWSAWAIDETTWKAHIRPVCEAFVNDMWSAYLRPALIQAGLDPAKYTLGYNARDILQAPDQTQNAKDAWDRGLISDETARNVLGFDDVDEMDEAEHLKQWGFLLKNPSMAAYGIPDLPRAAELEPSAGEIEGAPNPGQTDTAPVTPATTSKAPPTPPTPTERDAVAASGHLDPDIARILGACELSVERAREVAGSRIRGKVKDRAEYATLVGDLPNRLVASKLGRDKVEALKGEVKDVQLVAGASEPLTAKLMSWGVKPLVARMIVGQVESHAALTLYEADPVPLPASVVGYVHHAS